MKKIIAIILFVFVISISITYVAGAESGSVVAGTTASSSFDYNMSYTIEKLQEIAVSNSRQTVADDMDIRKKEMSVRIVHTDVRAMSDSILSVTKPMDVELELEAARKTRQDNLNQLKVDVYKVALNILLCNKEIGMQEQKLAMADEQLVMAKSRFKAAVITQEDLDSVQYNSDDKKVNLTNAKEKLDSLYLDLKKLLNLPLDTKSISIAGEIKQEKFEDVDIDFMLNELYKKETSVYKAAGKLEIAETAMDIAEKLYKKGDVTYDNSVIDLDEKEYNYLSAKTALDVKVKNAYNVMVNKLNDLELASKYKDLSAKKLNNIKVKYDKGIISKDDYLKAKDALLDAQYAELSSIVDFSAAKAEFNNDIGIE